MELDFLDEPMDLSFFEKRIRDLKIAQQKTNDEKQKSTYEKSILYYEKLIRKRKGIKEEKKIDLYPMNIMNMVLNSGDIAYPTFSPMNDSPPQSNVQKNTNSRIPKNQERKKQQKRQPPKLKQVQSPLKPKHTFSKKMDDVSNLIQNLPAIGKVLITDLINPPKQKNENLQEDKDENMEEKEEDEKMEEEEKVYFSPEEDKALNKKIKEIENEIDVETEENENPNEKFFYHIVNNFDDMKGENIIENEEKSIKNEKELEEEMKGLEEEVKKEEKRKREMENDELMKIDPKKDILVGEFQIDKLKDQYTSLHSSLIALKVMVKEMNISNRNDKVIKEWKEGTKIYKKFSSGRISVNDIKTKTKRILYEDGTIFIKRKNGDLKKILKGVQTEHYFKSVGQYQINFVKSGDRIVHYLKSKKSERIFKDETRIGLFKNGIKTFENEERKEVFFANGNKTVVLKKENIKLIETANGKRFLRNLANLCYDSDE